jgi:hypothetical protein
MRPPVEAKVAVGEPLHPQTGDARELVALREQIREAIAKLCS